MIRTIEQIKESLKMTCFIEGLTKDQKQKQLFKLWDLFKFQVWHECAPDGGWLFMHNVQIEKLKDLKSQAMRVNSSYASIIQASIIALERQFYEEEPWDVEFVNSWIDRMQAILISPIELSKDKADKINGIQMMDVVHNFRENYFNWFGVE